MPAPVPMMPQQAQPAGAQQPGQSPPFGSSPAMGATQNRGYEMAGIKQVGLALLILESAQPLVGSGTEPGKIVHRCIGDLAKIVPPGTVTPADIRNAMQQLMVKQAQFNQVQNQMRAHAMQGAAGAAPAQAAPAAQAA